MEAVRPPVSGPWHYTLLSGISSAVRRIPSLLPDNEDELPPLLITTGEDDAGGLRSFLRDTFKPGNVIVISQVGLSSFIVLEERDEL